MHLTGDHLIGADASHESAGTFRAKNPASGAELDPEYAEATLGEVDRALQLANAAHVELKGLARGARAELLDRITPSSRPASRRPCKPMAPRVTNAASSKPTSFGSLTTRFFGRVTISAWTA